MSLSRELLFKTAIEVKHDFWNMDLDYKNINAAASVFSSEGNIHPYPAKAVPNMVHDIIAKLKDTYSIRTVLDPFVGSGTVALESKILGLDFYGSDLNPLAVLLARTKSLTIKERPYIKKKLDEFLDSLENDQIDKELYILEEFSNIDFWFKEKNIRQLSYLKHRINTFLKSTAKRYKTPISLITLTAFSATIRESSLTRNDEFKLYRLSPADIDKFNVDSIKVFNKRIKTLLDMLQDVNAAFERDTICNIFLANAKDMSSYIKDTKIDLVITSPPYGDSQSTVAYGQFSKLSLQWMADLMRKYTKIESSYDNCDEYLLGGKHSKKEYNDQFIKICEASKTLSTLFGNIKSLVNEELDVVKITKLKLLEIRQALSEDLYAHSNFFNDSTLSLLIKEKIRLCVYRRINKNLKLSKKQIKRLTLIETEKILMDIKNPNSINYKRRIRLLQDLIPRIIETINRRILTLLRREEEVKHFFTDLYKVVEQSNNVITDNGIQVWIVGHRTILGNIEIKMADVLDEWFESIGYSQLALIRRNYHFKRLPHHINSTAARNQEVKTMMEEHVLIVRKNVK